ncbi:sensor domain-containing diguanylate cyclase [Maridesulfovibrio zosterae]|uniref:sensor domain-containing diguanylate cyclase n=1 Tax=Maridesulfovibrio zosterae TaxID=82171 RepID=UPI0004121C91|nr:diguanylate cyclase [Maridesulfovibrio zosterae]
MKNLSDMTDFHAEYDKLKKTYGELQQKVFEKCPECGQTRFKSLFEHAASAIAVLDKNGSTLFTNSAFHEITGYDQNEIYGYPLHKLLVPENDIHEQEYIKKLFCTPEEKANLNICVLDKDKNYRFVDMTVANVKGENSDPCSCICIFRDITSDKEHELRREELMEELMEAKEMQEDNAAQLALLLHELDEKNLELEKEIAERKKAEEKLKESEERFKNLSITDQLTGLFNRRHMVEVATREVNACTKVERALSIILMDIDDFKHFNDTYGHAAGDVVLESIGRTIRENIRYTDRAFRYGGEEFLVILPGTEGSKAALVAENIRKAVAAEKYYPFDGKPVQKTMSFGVSQYKQGEPLEDVLKRADDNMYKSKIRGKNKVYFSCETGDSSFL